MALPQRREEVRDRVLRLCREVLRLQEPEEVDPKDKRSHSEKQEYTKEEEGIRVCIQSTMRVSVGAIIREAMY